MANLTTRFALPEAAAPTFDGITIDLPLGRCCGGLTTMLLVLLISFYGDRKSALKISLLLPLAPMTSDRFFDGLAICLILLRRIFFRVPGVISGIIMLFADGLSSDGFFGSVCRFSR